MSAPIEALGPAQEIGVERDGDRDLVFRGWLIGHAQQEGLSGHWGVAVRIFLVEGSGRYVVASTRWRTRRVGGEPRHEEQHAAAACTAPEEVLAWLKQDASQARPGMQRLGTLGKQAWDQACQTWSALGAEQRERIT